MVQLLELDKEVALQVLGMAKRGLIYPYSVSKSLHMDEGVAELYIKALKGEGSLEGKYKLATVDGNTVLGEFYSITEKGKERLKSTI